MIEAPRGPVSNEDPAEPPATPAQLLGDIDGVLAELHAVRERVARMDSANGRFLTAAEAAQAAQAAASPTQPGNVAANPSSATAKPTGLDFVAELADRIGSALDRLRTVDDAVSDLDNSGFVATNYPNGRPRERSDGG